MSVLIIAEAGVNHNGDLKLAKKMVDVAVDAQVDIIKFQTFKAEQLVTAFAPKADYQKANTLNDENQLAMLQKLELSQQDHIELFTYCKQKGISFLSTAFDLQSLDFLDDFQMTQYKIPSGEITNLPYLIKIAEKKKPVILSTGMSNLQEIADAINLLKVNGCHQITVLQCNSQYPTPFSDVNLKAMHTIKEYFDVAVGYSDHTLGIEASIAAVALGATVIEKHFTLDKNMVGPDHQASLNPTELKMLVTSVRNVEKAIGDGVKEPSCSEQKNIIVARKSIVAKEEIKQGDTFTVENLTVKRPGNGISPMQWFDVLGKIAGKDFKKDEMIIL